MSRGFPRGQSVENRSRDELSAGLQQAQRLAQSTAECLRAQISDTCPLPNDRASCRVSEYESLCRVEGWRATICCRSAIALIDRGSIAWNNGETFLLASDGIFTLAEEEIAAIIAGRVADAGPDARGRQCQAAVDDLLDRVEQCAPPDQDNCTLILMAPSSAGHRAETAQAQVGRRKGRLFRPSVLLVLLGLGLAGLAGLAGAILASGSTCWNQLRALI